ncbi:MAG TPA: hypothetical protein VE957_01975 [Terriglobales bacterium]|nr:hypothetical protein [Terriglobales bacterium]
MTASPVRYSAFVLLVKNEFGLSLLDAEELVNIRTHFITNLFARPQAHHDQLSMLSRE